MTTKIRFLPLVLWLSVIFLFSSRPAVHTPGTAWQDFFIKKSAHIIEYSVCAFLAWHAFVRPGRVKIAHILLLWACLAIFALSDEYHQSFIPTREPRFRDVVIDASASMGVLTYVYLASIHYRIKSLKTIG